MLDIKKVLGLALAAMTALTMSAQEKKISSFEIDGLQHTKEHIIQKDLESFIGMEATPENLRKIEATLHQKGLFSEIKIEVADSESDENAEINLSLKEKITFIPIPIVMYSNGDFYAGAFILNTNAFGLKHLVTAGGYTSFGNTASGILYYQIPAVGYRPGIKVGIHGGRLLQEQADLDDEYIGEYDSIFFRTQLGLSENLTPWLTLTAGSTFNYYEIWNIIGNDDANDEESISFFPSLSIHFSDWNGYFISSKGLSTQYEWTYTTYHNFYRTMEAHGKFQQPVFNDRLRIVSGAHFFKGFEMPFFHNIGNSTLGVNLFPSKFGTNFGAGGSAGFEYAALPTHFGMFSLYADYQCAVVDALKPDEDRYQFNQGIGMGTYLYLNKIAFPALSMGAVYNLTKHRLNYSFSFGMNF